MLGGLSWLGDRKGFNKCVYRDCQRILSALIVATSALGWRGGWAAVSFEFRVCVASGGLIRVLIWRILCQVQLPYKGPCTQIVYALALTYLYGDYMKAEASTIWVHGPLGLS